MNYQSNYLISDTESEIDSIFNKKYLKETRGKSFIGGAVKMSDFRFNINFTPSYFLLEEFINNLEEVEIDLVGETHFNTKIYGEKYENKTENKTITYKDARKKPTEIKISYSSILDVLKKYKNDLQLKSSLENPQGTTTQDKFSDKVQINDLNGKNLSQIIELKEESKVEGEVKEVIKKILDNTKVNITDEKKKIGRQTKSVFANINEAKLQHYGNISFTVDSGLKTELENIPDFLDRKAKREADAKAIADEKVKADAAAAEAAEREAEEKKQREAAKAQGTRRRRTSILERGSANLIDTKIFVQFINEMKDQLIKLAEELKSMENIEKFFDFTDNVDNERKSEFIFNIQKYIDKLIENLKEEKLEDVNSNKVLEQFKNFNIKENKIIQGLDSISGSNLFDSLISNNLNYNEDELKKLDAVPTGPQLDTYLSFGNVDKNKKDKIKINMLFIVFLINSENINKNLKIELFEELKRYFLNIKEIDTDNISKILNNFDKEKFSGDYNLLELENLEKIFDNDQGLFDEVNLIENAEDLTNEYLEGIRTTLDTKAKELKTKLGEFEEEEEKQKQIKDAATKSIQLAEKALETIATDKDSTSKEVTTIEDKLKKVKTLLQMDGAQNHTLIKFLQLKKGSKAAESKAMKNFGMRSFGTRAKCMTNQYLSKNKNTCIKLLGDNKVNCMTDKSHLEKNEKECIRLLGEKKVELLKEKFLKDAGEAEDEYDDDEEEEEEEVEGGDDEEEGGEQASLEEEEGGDQASLEEGEEKEKKQLRGIFDKKYRKLPSILTLGLKNFL